MSFDSESTIFQVVINHEEQYSIWPSYKPIPQGWKAIGVEGDKASCLAHIREAWTDMRPKSLQDAMAGG